MLVIIESPEEEVSTLKGCKGTPFSNTFLIAGAIT
jgi:hypothetical protein